MFEAAGAAVAVWATMILFGWFIDHEPYNEGMPPFWILFGLGWGAVAALLVFGIVTSAPAR